MRRQRANSVACSKKELKKLAYFHELVKKEVEAGLINDESLNYIQTIQNVSTSSFSPPTKVLKPVSKIKLTTLKTPVSIKTIAKNFKHSVGSVSNETGVSTSPTDKLILVARKIQIETQTANGTSFLEATPTSIFRRQSPVQTSTANSQKSTAMKVKAAKNPTKSVQKQAQLASTSMNQSLKSDVDSPSASISTKIINDEPKSSCKSRSRVTN